MTARPSTDEIIDAVHRAASNLAAMADRIAELEADLDVAHRSYHEVSADLDDARRSREELEAALKEESRRRVRTETVASHQVKRADALETHLANTLDELARVGEAITSVLGAPGR